MTVRLIANPPFDITFRDADPVHDMGTSVCQKVTSVARATFDFIMVLATAAAETAATNVRYMGLTFKYVVLGYDGYRLNLPENERILLFKVSLWVVGHTIGYIFMTIFACHRQYRALPSYLLGIMPPEIDVKHLSIKKTKIETSHIPADIRVSTLDALFQEINFTRPDQAGYVPPSVRREDTIQYSVPALRTHLTTFIRHVEGRVAFLGTPPAYMAPQLLRFYQKIEDAVRFGLHKVITEYNDFMTAHEGVAPTKEDSDYKQYCNLLENKARVVIDMAIAGAHCGARYMGDALDTYMSMQKESAGGGLETKLWALLASRREQIARGDIQQHLGRDTHAFTSYMANIGGVLGIPGAEDVVEYLTSSYFDRERFLRLFFQRYTPENIRTTVQEAIKTSQSFREVLFDWLKAQSKQWKNEEYKQKANAILADIAESDKATTSQSFAKIEQFIGLVRKLHSKNVLPDLGDSWSEFLDELFAQEPSGAYFERQAVAKDRITLARAKIDLKNVVSNGCFEKELRAFVTSICAGRAQDLKALKAIAANQDKVHVINDMLSNAQFPAIDDFVLFRAVTGVTNLSEVVLDHVDKLREDEFLEALTRSDVNEDEDPAETVAQHGVKQEVLNWILYSHHIFKPLR